MTRKNDGSFAIELEGTFCTFGYGMEGEEMSRASELMDEIERRVVGLREKLWGIPPEVQARIDKLEFENTCLRQSLTELGRELVRIASKGGTNHD